VGSSILLYVIVQDIVVIGKLFIFGLSSAVVLSIGVSGIRGPRVLVLAFAPEAA
jgi:hypothetical protein